MEKLVEDAANEFLTQQTVVFVLCLCLDSVARSSPVLNKQDKKNN